MSFKKYIILLLLTLFCVSVSAQIMTTHTVKKRETIFGISRQYGITIDELINANPQMREPGYELQKGAVVNIPYSKQKAATAPAAPAAPKAATAPVAPAAPAAPVAPAAPTIRNGINVGIMLPLHDINGDGRRMVEYYRGLLMAVDQLKSDGVNINVRAWNVAENDDIAATLLQQGTDQLDIIFGPLYSKQVKTLGDFCRRNKIRMVIPFSINGDEVDRNEYIYQVYQSNETFTKRSIDAYINRFSGCHPIIIDCNDTTSRKGAFTFALRKRLEERGIGYSITNLRSSMEMFAKAFSQTKRNIVILNTGRSPELTQAMRKMDGLATVKQVQPISMFGYNEWQMYFKYNQNSTYFHKYDVYIPSSYYYNEASGAIQNFQTKYRNKFGVEMMNALPHFAVTGYDQGMYFIGGVVKYKSAFNGARTQTYATPLQTQYHFGREASAGGFRNQAFELVHYKTNGGVETLSY